MKNQTNAFFYDGKSSVRQEIVLFFDEKNESLHFVCQNSEQHIVLIKEINFEQRPTWFILGFWHRINSAYFYCR